MVQIFLVNIVLILMKLVCLYISECYGNVYANDYQRIILKYNGKCFTCRTNFWSIYFLAMFGWKSGDSRSRRNSSYTSWRCGQAASNVGSSSSGSNSAPFGFDDGGNVRNKFIANCGRRETLITMLSWCVWQTVTEETCYDNSPARTPYIMKCKVALYYNIGFFYSWKLKYNLKLISNHNSLEL